MMLVVKVLTVNSVEIDCNFMIFDGFEQAYGCQVTTLRNIGEHLVTAVKGDHKVGRSNDNVIVFSLLSITVNRIPSGLGEFFPSLETLYFFQAYLQTLTKDDMKQFPNLEIVYLPYNNIAILAGDVFKDTPHLRRISFQGTPLQNISQFLLDGLNELTWVDFYLCNCVSFQAQNPSQFPELRRLFAANCPFSEPPITTTTTEIITTTKIPDNECSSGCQNQINDLQLENEKLQFEIQNLHKREKVVDERFAEIERQLREINSRPCS